METDSPCRASDTSWLGPQDEALVRIGRALRQAPTEQPDAVFFGPDTYRFARAVTLTLRDMPSTPGLRVLDLGAGSGAGGLHAAALLKNLHPQIVLTDINRNAIRFCRINAAINEAPNITVAASDLYAAPESSFDLIIANPPYLVDPLARLYRHGGGELGFDLSLRIVREGITHLSPAGRLLLYTGSAIVDGVDLFERALRETLAGRTSVSPMKRSIRTFSGRSSKRLTTAPIGSPLSLRRSNARGPDEVSWDWRFLRPRRIVSAPARRGA